MAVNAVFVAKLVTSGILFSTVVFIAKPLTSGISPSLDFSIVIYFFVICFSHSVLSMLYLVFNTKSLVSILSTFATSLS